MSKVSILSSIEGNHYKLPFRKEEGDYLTTLREREYCTDYLVVQGWSDSDDCAYWDVEKNPVILVPAEIIKPEIIEIEKFLGLIGESWSFIKKGRSGAFRWSRARLSTVLPAEHDKYKAYMVRWDSCYGNPESGWGYWFLVWAIRTMSLRHEITSKISFSSMNTEDLILLLALIEMEQESTRYGEDDEMELRIFDEGFSSNVFPAVPSSYAVILKGRDRMMHHLSEDTMYVGLSISREQALEEITKGNTNYLREIRNDIAEKAGGPRRVWI